jgi:hypothetical protein
MGPLIEGSIRAIRQVKGGIQANVIVGPTDGHRTVTLTIVANSPEVRKAQRGLERAIQKEAAEALSQASANGAKWARAVEA